MRAINCLMLSLTAALTIACESPDSERPTTSVQVEIAPDPTLAGELFVEAQDFWGNTYAQTTAQAGGSLQLDLSGIDDDVPAIVAVANPADPGQRRFAFIPAGRAAFVASDGGTRRQMLGGAARVDTRSTARFLARTAAADSASTDAELDERYGAEIDVIEQAVSSDLCAGPLPTDAEDAVREVGADAPVDEELANLVLRAEAILAGSDPPELQFLGLQQIISEHIEVVNGRFDTPGNVLRKPLGFFSLAAGRLAIGTLTNQTVNNLTSEPIDQHELSVVAAITLYAGWGNCRENALLGALFASQVRGVQQVAVVGLERSNGGPHAVAIACLEGADVADLNGFFITEDGQVLPPAILDANCHVVDPWLDEGPARGNTGALTADYISEHGWVDAVVVKPVILDEQPSSTDMTSFDCNCRPEIPTGCEPFEEPASNSMNNDSNVPSDWPIVYAGTGEMSRELTITWDDMSSIQCTGTGIWELVLSEDGSARLNGSVDTRASFADGTTVCLDLAESPQYFTATGTHDGDTFTVEFTSRAFAVEPLSAPFGDQTLTIAHVGEETKTVAGFGPQTERDSVTMELVRQ